MSWCSHRLLPCSRPRRDPLGHAGSRPGLTPTDRRGPSRPIQRPASTPVRNREPRRTVQVRTDLGLIEQSVLGPSRQDVHAGFLAGGDERDVATGTVHAHERSAGAVPHAVANGADTSYRGLAVLAPLTVAGRHPESEVEPRARMLKRHAGKLDVTALSTRVASPRLDRSAARRGKVVQIGQGALTQHLVRRVEVEHLPRLPDRIQRRHGRMRQQRGA